ncbi:thioredoxin [bacterium]|nr:thioredoxin [bacterium]
MTFVKDIDQQAFGVEVLQRSHEVPVIVDFWAEWCEPCKVLGPTLERLADEYGGAFELVKVDVDANQQLATEFKVQSIPTVIAFKDGSPASQFMGAIPEAQVRAFIDGVLPTELDHKVELARDNVLSGDEDAAEALFNEVLDVVPDHPEAGTGLAALLIARGDTQGALIMLGRLARTAEVERLEAAARVGSSRDSDVTALDAAVNANPESAPARLELGKALAANHEWEPALDHLLEAVRLGGPTQEAARQAMVDVFGVLGNEHPLTAEYRKSLANALY